MLVAVLESSPGAIERDVQFACGVFSAEGLGEMSTKDLLELDAAGQLRWVSDDVRVLALGFSYESSLSVIERVCLADAQLQLAIETEVVYVPAHRLGSKTEAELKRIVGDMTRRGWILVEDTRMGAAGGHLTFQRAEPLGPDVLAAISFAG
jgi:hypothetical protein